MKERAGAERGAMRAIGSVEFKLFLKFNPTGCHLKAARRDAAAAAQATQETAAANSFPEAAAARASRANDACGFKGF